jgi:hypothetical protein
MGEKTMANFIVAAGVVFLVWLPLSTMLADRFGLLWGWFVLVKLTGM